jgi:hypothetical protein
MENQKKFIAVILITIILLALFLGPLNPYISIEEPSKDGYEKPAPFTTLLDIDGKLNFEVTTENGPANEVTIAVNPKDPNNIIAGAKDYTLGPSNGGYIVWSGYYWTTDGGKTWGNNLMGYPDISNSILGIYDGISDPVVAFDGQGNAYYSGLAYKSTSELVPDFPRPWIANNGIYMAKSTDGGETYSQINFVDQSPTGMVFHDKQWFTIDQDNGNIYVAWTRFQGISGKVVFSRSTDGGLTWSRTVDISRSFDIARQTSGAIPGVGPDGTVYVIWIDYNDNNLIISASNDYGASWPIFGQVVTAIQPTPSNLQDNDYRTPTIPSMAVDISDSNTSGNIYIVWSDYRNGNSDIMLTMSEDGGNSWSNPTRVNDDPDNSTADQYFPFIDVSPLGDIHIVFYDKRDDPDQYLLNLYYTHSRNGVDFDKNWKISTNASDPQYSYHQSGAVFIGDYIGIDSNENYAYALWADTRKQEADAYMAVIVGDVDLVDK